MYCCWCWPCCCPFYLFLDKLFPLFHFSLISRQLALIFVLKLRPVVTDKTTSKGAALTQISAYITHKNLAIRKIMEAIRNAYAKSGIRSQHVSNYTWGKRPRKALECCGREARIVCEQHFISLNRLMNPVEKVLLKGAIRFAISFRWYAFPNFRTSFVHLRTVCKSISSKASVAAASR